LVAKSIYPKFETMIKVMNTQQYAKEVYVNYSKTKTASQQRIRKMIKNGEHLPQVREIQRVGNNDYFILLHVEI